MKKLFPFFAIFCMFILWGCPEKEPIEEDVLEAVQTEYSIGAEGGEISISYKTNLNPTVTTPASWLTVNTKTKAATTKTVVVVASENLSTESRSAKVNISGGSLSAVITIVQAGKEKEPEPGPGPGPGPEPEENVLENSGTSSFNMPYGGGSFTVKVRSNVEYTVDCGADWIHRATTKTVTVDNVTFTVDPNEGTARNASVSFTYGNDLTFSVTVSQNAYVAPSGDEPYLTISSEGVTVDEFGGEISIGVNANYDYTVECDASWVTVKQTGETCILVIAQNTEPVDRSTMILFSSEGIIEYFNLVQLAQGSNVDPFDVGSNLSVKGTANCYIVPKAGNYTFDASVMGNGPQGFIWEDDEAAGQYLWPWDMESVSFKNYGSEIPNRAEELWDDNNVISDVSINSNLVVSFTATGNKGNAVIAIYNKLNHLLWSWHIWCTDSPARFHHETYNGTRIIMLDRNLGATSANPADGEATFGYWYQFGRKDPLKLKYGAAWSMVTGEKSMQASVEHPTTIYKFVGKDNEWFNGDVNTITADLWGNPYAKHNGKDHMYQASMDELRKTIYDPCPPGYMVPPEWAWETITLDDCDVDDKGLYVAEENGISFYPFAGFGDQGDEYGGDNGWYGYPGYTPKSDGSKYHHNMRNVVCCWSSGSEHAYLRSGHEWDKDNYHHSNMFVYMQNEEASGNLVMVNENSRAYLYVKYGHVRQRSCSVRCMKMQ